VADDHHAMALLISMTMNQSFSCEIDVSSILLRAESSPIFLLHFQIQEKSSEIQNSQIILKT
jgi:hypothetical protein